MRPVTSSPPDPLDLRTLRHAYDTVAEDYASHLPDTRAEAPLDLAMVDAFAEAVTSGDRARVLDAGCGAGRMSRYLAERGCLVEGIDLSSRMIAMARRDHRDVAFTVGSLSDLPYPDDQFAGVMLWYSIIHTPPATRRLLPRRMWPRRMAAGTGVEGPTHPGPGARPGPCGFAQVVRKSPCQTLKRNSTTSPSLIT
jgi:SAM-dependent methyltransferase